MRHLTAVEVDGGWRYANVSRRGGYPLGYCAEHAPHATEGEARECFSKWQRDHIRLDGKLSNWSDCAVCRGPAKGFAEVEGDGYQSAPLCGEHLTVEHAVSALQLGELAGDSWRS